MSLTPDFCMFWHVLCPSPDHCASHLSLVHTQECSGCPAPPASQYVFYYLDQLGPPSALVLTLNSRNCSTARKCPEFPFEASPQPLILALWHILIGLTSSPTCQWCCGLTQLAHTHSGSPACQWVRQPSSSWPVSRVAHPPSSPSFHTYQLSSSSARKSLKLPYLLLFLSCFLFSSFLFF